MFAALVFAYTLLQIIKEGILPSQAVYTHAHTHTHSVKERIIKLSDFTV